MRQIRILIFILFYVPISPTFCGQYSSLLGNSVLKELRDVNENGGLDFASLLPVVVHYVCLYFMTDFYNYVKIICYCCFPNQYKQEHMDANFLIDS